jgi:hypothetical protein
MTRSPSRQRSSAIGAKRTAPVDVERTLWIVAADAGTEGANVWVAEAFALEAKSVNTLDRPVDFRSAAPENRNKVTTNPDLLQSIVFVA